MAWGNAFVPVISMYRLPVTGGALLLSVGLLSVRFFLYLSNDFLSQISLEWLISIIEK